LHSPIGAGVEGSSVVEGDVEVELEEVGEEDDDVELDEVVEVDDEVGELEDVLGVVDIPRQGALSLHHPVASSNPPLGHSL